MASFLENLRKKTNQEKRAFALMLTAAITGIIFIVWMLTVSTTFGSDMEGKSLLNWDAAMEQAATVNAPRIELLPEKEAEDIVPLTIIWSTSTTATTTE